MKDNFALTLIAVLFGALLSSFGFLYRESRERKKILNSVVYHLLEIWYAVRVFTSLDAEISQILLNAFKRNFPGVTVSEKEKAELEKMITPLLGKLIPSLNISLNPSYQDVIKRLSVEEPILAFELSDNQNLKTFLLHLDDFISQVNKVESDQEAKKNIDTMRLWVSKHIHQKAINDLKRDNEPPRSKLRGIEHGSYLYEQPTVSHALPSIR